MLVFILELHTIHHLDVRPVNEWQHGQGSGQCPGGRPYAIGSNGPRIRERDLSQSPSDPHQVFGVGGNCGTLGDEVAHQLIELHLQDQAENWPDEEVGKCPRCRGAARKKPD